MLIKQELNKDNAIIALTGFVNLFTVLLKNASKTKINKAAAIGSKGIRIDIFKEFPTRKISIYFRILYYFKAISC